MIAEFKAFFTAFQQGKEIANPAKWKKNQITVNMLTGFLAALITIAGGFGYKLELSADTISQLSSGIIAAYTVINVILTCITTTKVGLKPKKSINNSDDAIM